MPIKVIPKYSRERAVKMYYQRIKMPLQKCFFVAARAILCSVQSFYFRKSHTRRSAGKAVLATFVDLYKIKSTGVPFEETEFVSHCSVRARAADRANTTIEPRCCSTGGKPELSGCYRQFFHAVPQQPCIPECAGHTVLRQRASLHRQLFHAD